MQLVTVNRGPLGKLNPLAEYRLGMTGQSSALSGTAKAMLSKTLDATIDSSSKLAAKS